MRSLKSHFRPLKNRIFTFKGLWSKLTAIMVRNQASFSPDFGTRELFLKAREQKWIRELPCGHWLVTVR